MSRPLRKTDDKPTAQQAEEPSDIHQIMRAIVLSDEDAARFEHRLQNPKEPTPALRDLMRMKV